MCIHAVKKMRDMQGSGPASPATGCHGVKRKSRNALNAAMPKELPFSP